MDIVRFDVRDDSYIIVHSFDTHTHTGTFARASKMNIKKKELASFLIKGPTDTDIIMLANAAIDKNKITDAEKIVTDALRSGESFVSTTSLFPEELTERDVATCVDRFEISNGSWRNGSSKGEAFACCDGQYILSCSFLDTCISTIKEREKSLIESGEVSNVSNKEEEDEEDYVIVSTTTSTSTKVEEKKKKNRRKKKGKKNMDREEDVQEQEDEYRNTKRGKKKKRRNKKGRRGYYSDDDEEENKKQNSKKKKKKNKKEDPVTSWLQNAKKLKICENVVEKLCPSMIEHSRLVQVVKSLVLSHAAKICVALRSEASRAVYRESISSQRKLRSDSEKRFEELWECVRNFFFFTNVRAQYHRNMYRYCCRKNQSNDSYHSTRKRRNREKLFVSILNMHC